MHNHFAAPAVFSRLLYTFAVESDHFAVEQPQGKGEAIFHLVLSLATRMYCLALEGVSRKGSENVCLHVTFLWSYNQRH